MKENVLQISWQVELKFRKDFVEILWHRISFKLFFTLIWFSTFPVLFTAVNLIFDSYDYTTCTIRALLGYKLLMKELSMQCICTVSFHLFLNNFRMKSMWILLRVLTLFSVFTFRLIEVNAICISRACMSTKLTEIHLYRVNWEP